MTITFTFETITIQVDSDSGKCKIYSYGLLIWSGQKEILIDILEQINKV